MRFSLILGTLGRIDPLKVFVESLVRQEIKDIELIIVDQSGGLQVRDYLEENVQNIDLIYLTNHPGLSRARNLGLKSAKGDIIAFPDDDCIYPQGLLNQVASHFKSSTKTDAVVGKVVDESGHFRFGTYPKASTALSISQIIWNTSSTAFFVRSRLVKEIGSFDENMGLGSGTIFQGAEEADYLVRAYKKAFCINFEPSICVQHPSESNKLDSLKRSYSSSAGLAYLIRKNKLSKLFYFSLLFRAILGVLYFGLSGRLMKARFHWASLRGRWDGWHKFPS